MYCYVVLYFLAYESEHEFLGVYDSKAKAKEAVKIWKNTGLFYDEIKYVKIKMNSFYDVYGRLED